MSVAPLQGEIDARRLRGVILVLLAGVAWSTGGPIMRSIEAASPWQILFWRSASMLATIGIFSAVMLGRRFLPTFARMGWTGLAASILIAGSFSLYIVALKYTSVANTLFTIACSPVVAAVLGGLLLKEGVRRATWCAIALAGVGVAVMVWDGFASGRLLGNLAALAAAMSFAGFTVVLRRAELRGGTLDMWPALCLGAVIGMALSALVATSQGDSLILSWNDTAFGLAFGVVQVGLGLVLYTLGARHLTAAEATLLALSEVVLGPIWTWLLFSETPSLLGLVGGLVLLGAMVLQAASGMRRRRPPIGMV